MAKFQSVSDSSQSAIGKHLLEFLRDKVNSFIKWDLVRFFHDNPHMKETPENIARYTGRDVRTIRRELNGLVETSILTKETVSDIEVYTLVNNQKTRTLIHEFIEACHDRQFRVEAIHQVIKEMQFSPRHDF